MQRDGHGIRSSKRDKLKSPEGPEGSREDLCFPSYKKLLFIERKLAPLLIVPWQAHYPKARDALQSFTLMLW